MRMDRPVIADVFALFESVIARAGPLPALIEWDNDVPEWPSLLAEALAAQRRLDLAASCRSAGRGLKKAHGAMRDFRLEICTRGFRSSVARPQCGAPGRRDRL